MKLSDERMMNLSHNIECLEMDLANLMTTIEENMEDNNGIITEENLQDYKKKYDKLCDRISLIKDDVY